ncbi:MAG: AgmX/PglI C-terminal domain-containing protein [Sandaracinaceae bacterium]|nr:AgmX/PglI C-terminal domain-containing protein [Sandaracinaceae bacterium]
MTSRPPSGDPPALGPVLRYYAPWLVGVAVAVLALTAYLDLRARVEALEERTSAREDGEVAAAPEDAPALRADRGEDTDADLAPAPAASDAGAARPASPSVTRGPPPVWSCTGSLSEQAVRAAVGRHGPTILRCYEERVAHAPGLRGTLLVRLRVEADGSVGAVYVGGIEDPPLVGCAGNAAVHWRFEPPSGGSCAVVEAPFALGRD